MSEPGTPSPASPGAGDTALTAEERALLAAHVQLRQAERARVERRTAEVTEYRRQRGADDAQRAREKAEAAERAALEKLPRTPNLPAYKRRNRRLYVLAEDLNDLLPDDWGAQWADECARLGKRMGMPPAAVPYLCILEWIHGLRPAATRRAQVYGTGCGLQASPEWIARKVGCSERWLQVIQARLDPSAEYRRELRRVRWKNAWREKQGKPLLREPRKPTGTSYVLRFQQIRHLKTLTQDLPYAERRERWLDRGSQKHPEGRLRRFCDVQGVTYPTLLGCRLLRRRAQQRHRPKPGARPVLQRSPMREDLYRRLAPLYRRLRARLSAAAAKDFTPLNVKPSVSTYIGPPVGRALRPDSGAGPPGAVRLPPAGGTRDFRQAVPSFLTRVR